MNNIRIIHIRYVLFAAEAGSFRSAALRLNVPQSVLSRRIREIEDHLGFDIFRRSPNGVRLTEEGEIAVRRIAQLIADFEALKTIGSGRAPAATSRNA